MQTFKTANFGLTTFEKTWMWVAPDRSRRLHLGLMASGDYATVPEGLPIHSRQDIIDCITPDEERERALAWFDRRTSATTRQDYLRKLYFDPDDANWHYLDNGEVVSRIEDLHAALKGPTLDGAVRWFQQMQGLYQQGHTPDPASTTKLLDQRITELLETTPGIDGGEIAQALDVEPRILVPILQSMRGAGRLAVVRKRYYLPDQLEEMSRDAGEN